MAVIDQDADSLAQVGDQASQWQVRSARLTFLGSIGKDYKVSYQIGGEYKGFDTDPVQSWQLTDLAFTFPIGGPNNKLTVGKTKETFSYEMVGDAANLPQHERLLSPFFVSRNVGVQLSNSVLDGRATWTAFSASTTSAALSASRTSSVPMPSAPAASAASSEKPRYSRTA